MVANCELALLLLALRPRGAQWPAAAMQGADRLLQQIFGHSQGAADLVGWDDPEDQAPEGQWEEGEQWEGGGGGEGEGGGEGAASGTHELELDASPEEVVRRIQSATLWFVSQLAEGLLPEIDLVSRAASNRALTSGGGSGGSGGRGEGDDFESAGGEDEEGGGSDEPYVLRLQQATQRRSLLGRHPESAEAMARLWVLLEAVQGMLLAGEQATQRELWYRFKTLEVFRSPRDVAEAIQDAVGMLQVPRSALGITASSKGLVGGRLVIHDQRAGTEMDCAAAACGLQVPGDIAHIQRDFAYQTDAQLVLVVEKDAVFQRLVQRRFFDRLPCILCTGKGVPDLATRAFLSCLSTAFPHLPLLGLVDWNPAGANILTIYRFGSHRMGLESPHYALPTLGWLGARASQLRQADADTFQELTARDRAMAANLAAVLAPACPDWAAELREMLGSGVKAELEALDSVEDLPDLLARCILQGDCV